MMEIAEDEKNEPYAKGLIVQHDVWGLCYKHQTYLVIREQHIFQ